MAVVPCPRLQKILQRVGRPQPVVKVLRRFFFIANAVEEISWTVDPDNTKGGSIAVPLTSCLTGLESAVLRLTIFVFMCKTD